MGRTSFAVAACVLLAACGDGEGGTALRGLVAGPPTCVTDEASGDCIGQGDEIVLTFTDAAGQRHDVTATIGSRYEIRLPAGRYAVSSDRESSGAIYPAEVVVSPEGTTSADLLWPFAAR